MAVWRNSETREAETEDPAVLRRAMGLLLDGAALHLTQVNPLSYRHFRSAILRDALRLRDPQTEADLLKIVGCIVCDFEDYRSETDRIISARLEEWRNLARMLALQLGIRDKVDLKAGTWTRLMSLVSMAAEEAEIKLVHAKLLTLFRAGEDTETLKLKQEKRDAPDRSEQNDNAAGLRGGGAAIEHVRTMMGASRPGFVGLFRLNCLDVVGERFGVEGIQDCLMAVSAFLSQNMRREDVIYHWSESSLLAVCDRVVREDILSAELNRLLAHNRDLHINIGDRTVMLRIPIELKLFPISQLNSAEDLQNLPLDRGKAKARAAATGMGMVNS
jgi:GGDEF domain-containing protein